MCNAQAYFGRYCIKDYFRCMIDPQLLHMFLKYWSGQCVNYSIIPFNLSSLPLTLAATPCFIIPPHHSSLSPWMLTISAEGWRWQICVSNWKCCKKRGENQLRWASGSQRVSETGSDRRYYRQFCVSFIRMERNCLLQKQLVMLWYKRQKKERKRKRKAINKA